MGKRDIVFGTDLKAETAVRKAKQLAKKLANPKASNWQARGDQRRTYYFADAKEQMPYRVCVPDAWDGESEMPMVVFLHGGWNDESSYLDQNDKQLVKIANQYGVLLVSPLGAHEGFGNFLRLPATFGHDDEMRTIVDELTADRIAASKLSEQDVINVIELVLAEYPVNPSAMYLMGHSMGSGGTWYLGAKYPDYWYGLVPISGPFTMRYDYPWERLRTKPIFMSEGLRAGASLGGSRDLYKFAHEELHLNIIYKEVDGDHGSMFPMILNDCFKFMTQPSVSIIEPTDVPQHLFFAPMNEAQFADITVRATASAACIGGSIEKIDFYDGTTLLETKTDTPYVFLLTSPQPSEHSLRVTATDNMGNTASATCTVNYKSVHGAYSFANQLVGDGIIPRGWVVSNGEEQRTGSLTGYSEGPRMLHFSNTSRGMEYGLLVQNKVGKAKAAWAKFGAENSGSRVTLHAGHYSMRYKLCNWDNPTFSPVTICVERRNGEEMASHTYTPTVNIGGSVSKRFGTVILRTFEFDIPETGDYLISFYTDSASNADFVLGSLFIQAQDFYETGIQVLPCQESPSPRIYALPGTRLSSFAKGVNIVVNKDGTVSKVFVK
ncbi:MAG: hypothetical protein J5770_01255 [Bacteroidaceae bacterium]|nr:hypothetical protein [Bacteroidaceae bacterium]